MQLRRRQVALQFFHLLPPPPFSLAFGVSRRFFSTRPPASLTGCAIAFPRRKNAERKRPFAHSFHMETDHKYPLDEAIAQRLLLEEQAQLQSPTATKAPP